jgi:predicted LPLAT superfamily acyltransferase
MPSWQGKSKGNKFGYGIFISILRRWGPGPAYFLLKFVTFYYLLFSRKSSRAMLSYFRKLGITGYQAYRKLYTNYNLLGQSIIDRIVLLSGIPNRLSFDFEGEDLLREMVALKKGGLLMSAHLGNWEIAGHLLKRLNTRVHVVMFDGEHQKLKEYLKSSTGETAANVIVLREDLSHIYAITEALKNNELVCMHADRFVEGNRTMLCPFLGSRANFPLGPFALAVSLKVPVSFVFAMKESKHHYHFFASPLIFAGEGSKEDQMHSMLKAFVSDLEKKTLQYPEQWFNYFDFWQN